MSESTRVWGQRCAPSVPGVCCHPGEDTLLRGWSRTSTGFLVRLIWAAAFLTVAFLAVADVAARAAPNDATACENGSGDEAIAACTREIESGRLRGRALADAYLNRGIAYADKRDFDRAIADFSQAIKLDPKNSLAFYMRGRAYIDKGDYTRAVADLTEAIKLDPKEADNYNYRGLAYRQRGDRGDYARAIADFDAAIRLNPKSADAHNNRGLAYSAAGDYERAIADFTAAMRLNPRSDVPYYNRGRAYARKGDRERAISDFNEAIRLNPNGALSYFMRGIEYDIAGDTERAIADFNDAIRLDPKLAGAHDHLGEIYKGKREFDRAIAAYSEAIRQEPRNGRILWHRADTYLVMGELDRAIADYTAALGGDQDGACASCVRFGRGIAYFYAGQLANALADMRAANELDPKDAYVALWVDIIGQRSKAPSRLAQMIAKLDMSKWPAPIVRLYSGQSNAQAVVTAANDGKADDRKRRVCEANFYNAEWALRAGTKEEDAAAMFRQAAADCPGDPNTWSIDYTMPANAELKALGATP